MKTERNITTVLSILMTLAMLPGVVFAQAYTSPIWYTP